MTRVGAISLLTSSSLLLSSSYHRLNLNRTMSASNNCSHNHFKTIAISGVGGLGAFILNSLVAHKSDPSLKIIVLSRTQKAIPILHEEGFKLVEVDYEDEESLEAVLR